MLRRLKSENIHIIREDTNMYLPFLVNSDENRVIDIGMMDKEYT